MAITVPTAWQTYSAVAYGSPLLASDVGALVENEALVRSKLRELAPFAAEFSTTSTSYVDKVTDWPVEASDNTSGTLEVGYYGTNVTVRVEVTDGTSTVNDETTISGGPSFASSTINASSLTGTAWRMTVKIKVPSAGTAELDEISLREQEHTSGTVS